MEEAAWLLEEETGLREEAVWFKEGQRGLAVRVGNLIWMTRVQNSQLTLLNRFVLGDLGQIHNAFYINCQLVGVLGTFRFLYMC